MNNYEHKENPIMSENNEIHNFKYFNHCNNNKWGWVLDFNYGLEKPGFKHVDVEEVFEWTDRPHFEAKMPWDGCDDLTKTPTDTVTMTYTGTRSPFVWTNGYKGTYNPDA